MPLRQILISLAVLLPGASLADAQAGPKLPAYVIELPQSVASVFVADTGTSTIYRFDRGERELALGNEGYMSIGLNGAGKSRAWDRKTPLGIYFVVDRLATERLHEKYGAMAFPLDYPNAWDRRNERTGDGIWVHGVLPGGERRPTHDTDGCIALPNNDLEAQAPHFVPLVTPVIVTREIEWRDPPEIGRLREEFRAALAAWKESLESGDLHAYLSMYADDFRYGSLSIADWAALRFETIGKRGAVEIVVDEIALLADPEVDNLYLSRFRQRLTDDVATRETVKRLYWRRSDEGNWRIVAEDNG